MRSIDSQSVDLILERALLRSLNAQVTEDCPTGFVCSHISIFECLDDDFLSSIDCLVELHDRFVIGECCTWIVIVDLTQRVHVTYSWFAIRVDWCSILSHRH